jgi:hypothetical protein
MSHRFALAVGVGRFALPPCKTWESCAAVTEPQTPHTVIYTEHVTVERLHEMRGHLPMSMFVSDGDERVNPKGGWLRYSASALFRTRRRLVTCGVARH